MRWIALPTGDPVLFADAPPPEVFYFAGSHYVLLVIAGIFLSLAAVTGGIWLINRRSQNRPALLSGKLFWLFLGGLALLGVVLVAAWVPHEVALGTGVMLGGGLIVVVGTGALATYLIA